MRASTEIGTIIYRYFANVMPAKTNRPDLPILNPTQTTPNSWVGGPAPIHSPGVEAGIGSSPRRIFVGWCAALHLTRGGCYDVLPCCASAFFGRDHRPQQRDVLSCTCYPVTWCLALLSSRRFRKPVFVGETFITQMRHGTNCSWYPDFFKPLRVCRDSDRNNGW